MLGFSGATIKEIDDTTVLKEGGASSLRPQADRLRLIGTRACAEVFHINSEGANFYTMERCWPLQTPVVETVCDRLIPLLKHHVWTKPAPASHFCPTWKNELYLFVHVDNRHIAEALGRFDLYMLDELYPTGTEEFCLTHGDATVANVMMRPTGSLVLIDPIPPHSWSPEVKEADLCGVIQSMYGWENALEPGRWIVPQEPAFAVHALLKKHGFSELEIRRAYFWAALKCFRICRYGRAFHPWALEHFNVFQELARP